MARMSEGACILDQQQRHLVETTITEHCRFRGWDLRAVNCRSNHLHVVVTADRSAKEVRNQFKAWCTRKLKELQNARGHAGDSRIRDKWWAERGSGRYIGDEDSLEAVILYVMEGQ